MNQIRIAVPALALMLGMAGLAVTKASAAPLPRPYGQDRDDWRVPPRDFNDVQRRGFQDGMEGAQKDYGNHRSPDVNNREEYRDPHMDPGLREAYQRAFRRGYEVAASHLYGGEQGPPPPVAGPAPGASDWAMRGLDSDAERQGFREGQEEAHKDFNQQRRADPEDHEEFRNPRVPPDMADGYREGFMRGYEAATSQLSGEPAWQNRGDPSQWQAPRQFTEMQSRGFQEGIEGARRDFGNHRSPNVVNREEYRTPRVPQPLWHEYREGFRRGYEMTAAQLWGGM